MVDNKVKEGVIFAVLGGIKSDNVLKQLKSQIPQGAGFKGTIDARIRFELTKGVDTDAAPTASILSQAVLAKALVYAGITSEAFKAHLFRAAMEALSAGDKVGETLSAEDQRVVAMIEEVKTEVINRLPRQPKNGSVRVKAVPEITKVTINELPT